MNTWLAVGKELGLRIDTIDYLEIVGRSSAECHSRLIKIFGTEQIFQEALQQVRQRLKTSTNRPIYPLKPGVSTLLSTLNNANIPCAVASSSDVEEIKSRLTQVDVLRHFDVIAGGDEVAIGKPDPAVYRLAALRLQKSPHDCLAFEDSENGMLAAVRSGMKVVVVPDLKQPTIGILEHSFAILRTLDETMNHLPTWFGLRAPYFQ